MKTLLGIDIGTSSSKALLMDTDGTILDVQAEDYDVDIPQEGYAQQDPEHWWSAVRHVLHALKEHQPEAYASIAAIGFSGQMHGLVPIDENNVPVHPVIIWPDQRSQRQLDEINRKLKKEDLAKIVHNKVFTGFAFPSLLWMKENRPECFQRIHKILMPKDYIRMKLTGTLGTDVSDASSTAGFDMKQRDWAWEILKRFDLPEDIFPECYEAMEIAGYTTKECEEQTGLKTGIPVVFGSGDQPAHTIGSGVTDDSVFVSSIGTGGQVAVYSQKDTYDPEMRIHIFCHAINKVYTIFGAQGLFFGLQLQHNRNHFVRAVMEGVIYDFHETLDIFKDLGIDCPKVIACGGGAQSPVWLQIQADILNKDIQVCVTKEQACLGACIMAGVGAGILDSLENACKKYIRLEDKIYHPIPSNVEIYQKRYKVYRQLYSSVKDLYER